MILSWMSMQRHLFYESGSWKINDREKDKGTHYQHNSSALHPAWTSYQMSNWAV